MNAKKPPMKKKSAQRLPKPLASQNVMEWNVNPGRGSIEGDGFSVGQNMDADAYLPFTDDEDSPGSAGFNFDLQRFIVGAWQRRYIGLATVVIITTLTALLIGLSVSKSWQASTALIKRTHQDRLALTDRNSFKSQDYNLATLLDTLKLPSSLEKVRQRAEVNVSLATLAQAIDVSLGRDSKIINLKVTWSSPEKAAELANLLAETFIDRTRLLLGDDATGAYEYYAAQLAETRVKAQLASADVLAFRQKFSISNLDAETSVLLEEMSRLEGDLNSRIAEVGALKDASSRLMAALEEEPEQVITSTIYRSPLQTRLAEYEWELRDALSKYTDLNPKVIKLNERIASLKQMISDTNDETIPENTYALNSKRREMELRLQLLADDIKLREAQAVALEQTLESMGSKVALLSDWEKDYLLLQSRLDGVLALEKELTRRVDETRLIIERNDASFDIVETAAIPTHAMPTGRKLMAIAGLIIALGSGLMLVLLLEWRDPMVRSRRDVMDIVGIDNCVEIPSSLAPADAALDFSQPSGQLANLYRSLSNDMDVSIGTETHVPVAIISANAGAGRSTAAANLAATRIIKGQKVLLVDADLRQQSGPRPGELLNLAPVNTGIYEHLLEGHVLTPQSDEKGDLHYIAASAGGLNDDLGLLALGATNLSKFLKPFQGGRYTIVDLPPLKDLEVVLEMAGQLNHALLVVHSGETRRDELKKIMAQLHKRGIDCIATIVLDVPEERLEAAKLFSVPRPDEFFKSWRKASFA
jgi:uncharacterized protein involved in exopolysaccharide biosynthesis/Mrp family chromosome partitioning ATPase